jgi:type I restriction enzyme S subunit
VERINSFTKECEAVLTAGDGVGVGRVFHYYNGRFDFHQRVYMLNGFKDVSGRYLFWYLKENFYKVALEGGAKSTVDSLRMPLFLNFPVTVPPSDEQESVVDFVRRESAKIDELVDEQRRLVDLLTEKRQSVISQAVTKGMDSDATMKDSDVEWLGTVPRHWAVTPIRRVMSRIEQGWSPRGEDREPDENEWGVLKLSAVKSGDFDESKIKALESDQQIPKELQVRSGDLLLTRANTPELVGQSCFVQSVNRNLIFSDLIYRLSLDTSKIFPQFLNLFLQSSVARLQIESDARGSSQSMVKISHDHILSWVITLPPVVEQKRIVETVHSILQSLDSLTAEATHAIDLLQERRTALISAAVTGKIDVRGMAKEQTA